MFCQPENAVLKDLVVCYWLIKAGGMPDSTKMLPDGYSDIMLNFGDPYEVSYGDTEAAHIAGHALFGQRTQTTLLRQPGEINMIGIRLRPGSEYAFAGMPANTIVNKWMPLGDMPGLADIAILCRRHDIDEKQIVQKLDNLLLHLFAVGGQTNDIVNKAASSIIKLRGNINIDELTHGESAISYKYLERNFRKYIGLSPKLYARIHRFHYAFTQVRGLQKADWMQVLHNCGYYDQSHFIKDFCHFSGVTPTTLFSEKNTIDHFFGFR